MSRIILLFTKLIKYYEGFQEPPRKDMERNVPVQDTIRKEMDRGNFSLLFSVSFKNLSNIFDSSIFKLKKKKNKTNKIF